MFTLHFCLSLRQVVLGGKGASAGSSARPAHEIEGCGCLVKVPRHVENRGKFAPGFEIKNWSTAVLDPEPNKASN
jgi:hypothetical protein